MTRRKRSDSVAFAADVTEQIAEGSPAWPRAMHPPTDEVRFAYEALVESRPYPAWTSLDRMLAAHLAWTLCKIARLERELNNEGETLRARDGRSYANPKIRILDTLRRMASRETRYLGLDLLSRNGARRMDGRELTRAARAAQQIRDDFARAAQDDDLGLLALPDEVRERLPRKKAKRRKPN